MYETLTVVFVDPADGSPRQRLESYVDEVYQGDFEAEYVYRQSGREQLLVGDDLRATIATPDIKELPHDVTSVELQFIRRRLLENDEERSQQFEKLFTLVEIVYEALSPAFVYGGLTETYETMLERPAMAPISAESLAEQSFDGFGWLTGLPPEMVENYDREELLALPAAEIRELPDGGLVVLSTTDIGDSDVEEIPDTYQRLNEQFHD